MFCLVVNFEAEDEAAQFVHAKVESLLCSEETADTTVKELGNLQTHYCMCKS